MEYDKNPLTPHLQIYKWQISSLLSITHRITGVINAIAISLICIWFLFTINNEKILFENILNSFFGKFISISLCWTFSFHILNEIRHLTWDAGYGFDLKISKITGYATLILSFLLAIIIYFLGEFLTMNKSTKKWLFIKFSSLFLIPFMVWFILNFVSIINNNDYNGLLTFLSEQPSKILFSIFVFLSLFFYSLTISEIFEDYMSNEKIKKCRK